MKSEEEGISSDIETSVQGISGSEEDCDDDSLQTSKGLNYFQSQRKVFVLTRRGSLAMKTK